jgi:molybdopterin molybdotransferase
VITFEQARDAIITQVSKLNRAVVAVDLAIDEAAGSVLAQPIAADRDYPPFDRATRDGFAVRAAEATAGASLRCIGEVKAGDADVASLEKNSCIQIMTGAALPSAADAVVMIEYTRRDGDLIHFTQAATPGQNIVKQGSEASKDQVLLTPGTRLGYAELALAAQVGAAKLRCAKKPRVAILSTGDEIIPFDTNPAPFQIRNSNVISLTEQVRQAGGEPVPLGNAADEPGSLEQNIARGLHEDILVLSGGVSMGKYDLVEDVLKKLGATFYFDSVAIRPGKPAVFALCNGKPVFGLPGNPISTMVTFQLFVVPAIDMLSGCAPRPLPFLQSTLATPLAEKPGMTHFLPALLEWRNSSSTVSPLPWQGSGDTVSMARANCFLVVPSSVSTLPAGEKVNVLLRKDVT